MILPLNKDPIIMPIVKGIISRPDQLGLTPFTNCKNTGMKVRIENKMQLEIKPIIE